MSVVVDNSFSADTYGMRTERLIAINAKFVGNKDLRSFCLILKGLNTYSISIP